MKVEKIIYILNDKHIATFGDAKPSTKERPCILLHSDDNGVIVVRSFSKQKKVGGSMRLEIEYLTGKDKVLKSHLDHSVVYKSEVNESKMIEMNDLKRTKNSRELTDEEVVKITIYIQRNFNKEFKSREKLLSKKRSINK